MEDGIQINVDKVFKVGNVGGGHRIHRLVGEGERVQKRLHARLQEVYEWLFDRVFRRAAKHRVLNNVKNAGVVCRRRLEGDGKRAVRVVCSNPGHARAGLFVAQNVAKAVHLVNSLDVLDEKATYDLAFFKNVFEIFLLFHTSLFRVVFPMFFLAIFKQG